MESISLLRGSIFTWSQAAGPGAGWGEESPGPAPRYLIATIAHYFTLQTLIHNTTYLPTITSIPSAVSTHGEVS